MYSLIAQIIGILCEAISLVSLVSAMICPDFKKAKQKM